MHSKHMTLYSISLIVNKIQIEVKIDMIYTYQFWKNINIYDAKAVVGKIILINWCIATLGNYMLEYGKIENVHNICKSVPFSKLILLPWLNMT